MIQLRGYPSESIINFLPVSSFAIFCADKFCVDFSLLSVSGGLPKSKNSDKCRRAQTDTLKIIQQTDKKVKEDATANYYEK